MPRQIQFPNDFRPKLRDNIGSYRKLESRKDFFGYRRAAEHVPALAYQNTLSRASQVGRIHQSVVPATNNDDIVGGIHADSYRKSRRRNKDTGKIRLCGGMLRNEASRLRFLLTGRSQGTTRYSS